MPPGVGLLPQNLASVGGGWARHCGGRTTPAPIPHCWKSSCRECKIPCATPIAKSTSRRRAPRGAPAAPVGRTCAAPRGRGGPRDPSLLGSLGTPHTRRRRWPPVRLRSGEVVQLHAVMVAQPAHEAARRRREATLVVADEADDVAVRRVGLPIRHRRTIHARGCPSTFGANWPPFSSSCSANSVTVERGHGSGSSTWIDCGGAIAVGGSEWKREGQRTLGGTKGRAVLWSGSKKDGSDGR
jgi:hypothetical protein